MLGGLSNSGALKTGLPAEQPDEELIIALRTSINDNLSDKEKLLIALTIIIIPSCYSDLESVALIELYGWVPGFLSDLLANPLGD